MAAAVRAWVLSAAATAASLLVVNVGGNDTTAPVCVWNPSLAADVGDGDCMLPRTVRDRYSDPFEDFEGVRAHLNTPYIGQLLHLLRTPMPITAPGWIQICAQLKHHNVDDDFAPRSRWYLSKYPPSALARIFDLVRFYFCDYDRAERRDPARWTETPVGYEVITPQLLSAYIQERGLNGAAPLPSWGNPAPPAPANLTSYSLFPAPPPVNFPTFPPSPPPPPQQGDDDDDDDDDEGLFANGAPNVVNSFAARWTGTVRQGAMPGNVEAAPDRTTIELAHALSGFPDAAALEFQWWTEVGAAAAIFGVVLLAIAALLLADTHVLYVRAPDADAEPREVHYVLKHGTRISVRPGAPRGQFAPLAPATC